MERVIPLGVERMKRLPQRSGDVWELAIVRQPGWVVGEERPPYRPVLYVCRSRESGMVGVSQPCHPEELLDRMPLEALQQLSVHRDVSARPGRVAVRDPRLVAALGPELAALGIEVDLVESLDLVDEAYADMTRFMCRTDLVPGYLDAGNVDVARLRSFAEAAVAFHRHALWNHLSDQDLLRIESPVPDAALRFLAILGGAGHVYGIGFYASELDHARIQDAVRSPARAARALGWLLSFDPAHEIPIPDADVWETNRLPLAGESAHPFLFRPLGHKRLRRPSAPELAFVEGLLRALSLTTEDEIDSGRWTRTVPTFDGPLPLTLTLPALDTGVPDRRLMERTMKELWKADTPAERADELVYEAMDASGRLTIKLAREAIRTWPDCADAYVLLAEEMPDFARKTELYRLALEAGERALGAAPFRDDIGHFWGILETRPYMRARAGVADCLWEAGRRDEAIGHWKGMLQLNPGDNQGVRFLLIPRLLEMGRDEEALRALADCAEEPSAVIVYSRALLDFRRGGDAAARASLETAVKANPHVLKFLLGRALPEVTSDFYALGDENEAVQTVELLGEAWARTPGAPEWLRDFRRQTKKSREQKRGQKKPRRR